MRSWLIDNARMYSIVLFYALQVLGQLQMKMIEIQTSLRKSTGQIEGLKREIQRSKLTDKEINTMKDETPMFSPVGRM
jgi:hypothetical protein